MRANSLNLIDKELAAQLEGASEDQLRAASLAACRFALTRIPMIEPIIEEGMNALQQKHYGDQHGLRARLEEIVRAYDEKQWALEDEDKGDKPEYFDAFEKARVANVLYYALDVNPWLAATRAIYDAEAATNDLTSLKEHVRTAMSTIV